MAGPKRFVNEFLELSASYEFTGSDHLWTLITRNDAGAITQIQEPSTTAPSGYSGATGGAIHQFEIDKLGRVVAARAYTGTPSSGTLATSRVMRYDELGRQIWIHDLVLGFGSGDRYFAVEYAAGKESQIGTVRRSGLAEETYEYWSNGLLKTVNDGFGSGNSGNTVTYAYHSNTTFASSVTRTDLDPANSSPRVTVTSYDVDPFGRVIGVHEGSGTTLDHLYGYNSLGQVDRYTNPDGRLQEFLPDAIGRIVEHVRVGDSDYIQNAVVFEDSGASDGRTKELRYDGLGNVTITHSDFAGRPFIVQNPGGSTAPTSSAKNQSMCLYAEYDGASRIKAIYDGDVGTIEFWRDGPGRMIQRQLTVAGINHTLWNTKDVLRRDAIGRLYQTDIWASYGLTGYVPDHGLGMAVEQFDRDSIGRTHEERYNFAFAPSNVLDVTSSYTSGNPFRDGLNYADNLTGANSGMSAPIDLDFTHDEIGRLAQIDWNAAPGGSGQSELAEYTWVGGLRRGRTVRYGSGAEPKGVTSYEYDGYNRLLGIQDEVWTSSSAHASESQFDYVYDAASNLIKEKYAKVDGSVGDRFAYDAYHRLTAAWMGVDTTTMNATSDPSGWSSGSMHEYLTYGLDEANNRTTSTSQVTSTGLTTDYTLQDSGNAQGPSNRYDTVSLPNATPVTYEYDNRGNLRYDGRFLYRYDFLNRLQEVWSVTLTEHATGSSEKFAIVDPTSLDDATQEVKNQTPTWMSRLPREHKDPVFRARLKARLHGGVIRLAPPQTFGGGGCLSMASLIDDADLDLVAVYVYDAFNRRIMSIVVGGDTEFHTYDGWRQVVQYTLDSTNSSYKAAPTKEFAWGARLDELLSYRRRVGSAGNYSWENYYVLQGGQDTAARLVDDAGNVVERYEYDPYGRVSIYVGSSTTAVAASYYGLPFLWKSIRIDEITGLLYMRNRYYSVELGRFLTMDPVGIWADEADLGNGHAYCGNEPMAHSDPLGLQTDPRGQDPSGPPDRITTNKHDDARALTVGDFKLPPPAVPPTTTSGRPANAASAVGLAYETGNGKINCVKVDRSRCISKTTEGPVTGGLTDPCTHEGKCPECWECTYTMPWTVSAVFMPAQSWMSDPTALIHEQGHLHVAIMIANMFSGSSIGVGVACKKPDAERLAKQDEGERRSANWTGAKGMNRRLQKAYELETQNGTSASEQSAWNAVFAAYR